MTTAMAVRQSMTTLRPALRARWSEGKRTGATAALAVAVMAAVTLGGVGTAAAADPLKVGVLIPGSKSDKGWMESGYDGLMRAEKKHGAKVKVTFVENVKFADMEQALTMLATKSDMVIGVGGQTQASVLQGGQALPQDQVLDRRGQQGHARTQHRAVRRAPGGDRVHGGRVGGDAVEERRRQLRRRAGDPGHRQRRQGVRQRRQVREPEDQVLRVVHRRLRRRGQVQGGDAGRHRPGGGRPLSHPEPGAARDGAGGAREEDAHHRQLHRSLRHRPALQSPTA